MGVGRPGWSIFVSRIVQFSIVIMIWTDVFRGFVVCGYYTNKRLWSPHKGLFVYTSVIHALNPFLLSNLLHFRFEKLKETGSILSARRHGAPRALRNSKSVQLVREEVKRSPRHSVQKHKCFGISIRFLYFSSVFAKAFLNEFIISIRMKMGKRKQIERRLKSWVPSTVL